MSTIVFLFLVLNAGLGKAIYIQNFPEISEHPHEEAELDLQKTLHKLPLNHQRIEEAAEVLFRPAIPLIYGPEVAAPYDLDDMENIEATEENRQLRALNKELSILKGYMCSKYYSFTCHALRHFQLQLRGELEREKDRRQRRNPAPVKTRGM